MTAAASVVHSADRAGLTTRFVTTDGADIRGPDVAAQTLHLLARIAPEHDARPCRSSATRAKGSGWSSPSARRRRRRRWPCWSGSATRR